MHLHVSPLLLTKPRICLCLPCPLSLAPLPAGQLGAEGFIMGSLYTLVGLAVAGLIFIVPKVRGRGMPPGFSAQPC